jgi:hypothetical protein
VPLSPLSFDTDPEAKSLQLQVGIVRGGSVTPAMDVHFDNVVVTFP